MYTVPEVIVWCKLYLEMLCGFVVWCTLYLKFSFDVHFTCCVVYTVPGIVVWCTLCLDLLCGVHCASSKSVHFTLSCVVCTVPVVYCILCLLRNCHVLYTVHGSGL